MHTMAFSQHGGPEVLAPLTLPTPTPGPGELLVLVKAAGVNPIDTKVRRGEVPVAPRPEQGPVSTGYDGAGVVLALGAGVTDFAVGDDVWFLGRINHQGAYATHTLTDARLTAPKPASLGFEEAASVPLPFLTAWETLVENMHIPVPATQPSHPAHDAPVLLVVGGAGGVGSMAIPLAKKVLGLRVAATASRPASQDFCQKLGADWVLNHHQPLAPQLKALGLNGVDYLLNNGPNDTFGELAGLLNPLGHIGLLAGSPELSALNVTPLRAKRAALSFTFVFTRALFETAPEKQGQALCRAAAWFESGLIVPALTSVLPLAEAAEAHRRIETGHTLGKLVLRVEDAQD